MTYYVQKYNPEKYDQWVATLVKGEDIRNLRDEIVAE